MRGEGWEAGGEASRAGQGAPSAEALCVHARIAPLENSPQDLLSCVLSSCSLGVCGSS